MPKKKPIKSREETIIEKAMQAKAMLYIHGFLSDAENERVYQRILKRVPKAQPKRTKQNDH